MSKLFDIGQPNQTTPAQPVSAGMVTVRLDMLHALNEWLDYARNPFDPYHDSDTREAWVWLDQARDELRAILAAPAPADHVRPSRAEAKDLIAKWLLGLDIATTHIALATYGELADALVETMGKAGLLAERLTAEAGSAAGEGEIPQYTKDGERL
jgi:hypothetical protein